MTSRQRRALPRAVRIIGGQWKRSKLPVADVPGLRPTPDRVRETLFNWLGQDLAGWRCLDAFAGSGALGFEAASRGAVEVILLERDRSLARSLAETQRHLGAAQIRIENADAISWMARRDPGSFDLVFIDPPFDSGLLAPALDAAIRVIARDGLVYLESRKSFMPDGFAPGGFAARGLQVRRQSRAGAVHFQLLQRASEEPQRLT